MSKSATHFIRTYGAGLKEHSLTEIAAPFLADFAKLELRMLAYYSDCDPRNHYGKFANRRNHPCIRNL